MTVEKADNQLLRRLDFKARTKMEAEARAIEKRIIQAYTDAQINIAKKIERYQKSVLAGLDPDLIAGRVRLESLKKSINEELLILSDKVEGATRATKTIGIEKGRTVVNGSRKILEIQGPAWNTFLASDISAYLDGGFLLRDYPSSVKTYGNLIHFFERQRKDIKYFDNLIKGLGGQQEILLNLKWGTLKQIEKSIKVFKELGIAWNPLIEIEATLRTAIAERISYGELVTRFRHDVWHLPRGARVPNVTSQALRLARTEMISSSAISQNAWGFETPGISSFRRWFGGGACNGVCLQYVGVWLYDGSQPEPIPVHPYGACYDTFETVKKPKQHHQEVLELENGNFMDRMTFDHNSIIAERLGEDMPNVIQRYNLFGSNRFGTPFDTTSEMIEHVRGSRLHLIN